MEDDGVEWWLIDFRFLTWCLWGGASRAAFTMPWTKLRPTGGTSDTDTRRTGQPSFWRASLVGPRHLAFRGEHLGEVDGIGRAFSFLFYSIC